MVNAKEQTEQKHKSKSEATELEVLVQESNNYFSGLQQRHIPVMRKKAIWEAICDKPFAVGKTKRAVD